MSAAATPTTSNAGEKVKTTRLINICDVRDDTNGGKISLTDLAAELNNKGTNNQQHPDINVRVEGQGMTALLNAVVRDPPEATKMLLEAGADPNIQCVHLDTALHAAVGWAKPIKVIRWLLQYGADPSIKNNSGKTALDIAVLEDDKEVKSLLEAPVDGSGVFRLLMERGSNCCKNDESENCKVGVVDDVDVIDVPRLKLMHKAHQLDLNATDADTGDTALHHACFVSSDDDGDGGDENIEKKEKETTDNCQKNEKKKKQERRRKRRIHVLELLLKAGASPTIQNEYAMMTPLHYCAAHNGIMIEEMKLLLTTTTTTVEEQDKMLQMVDCFGKTPLHYAYEKEDKEMIQLLLEGKEDDNSDSVFSPSFTVSNGIAAALVIGVGVLLWRQVVSRKK